MLPRLLALPMKKLAVTALPKLGLTVAVTANPVNVPTLVMLVCEAVVSVPVRLAALTVPVLANTLPATTFPVTPSVVKEPTLVTLG